MATARLIGRLGGPPEVVETGISSSSSSASVTVPAGWGSAWCVFQGKLRTYSGSAQVFGLRTEGDGSNLKYGTDIGGGVLLQAGQSTTIGSRLEGTLTQIRMS